jgi:hypothetical protein
MGQKEGGIHLRNYVRQDLLWISMAENRNCSTTLSKNLPYQTFKKNPSSGSGLMLGHRQADRRTHMAATWAVLLRRSVLLGKEP